MAMKRLDAIVKHDMLSVYEGHRPNIFYNHRVLILHDFYHFDNVRGDIQWWVFVLGLRGDRRADDISALQDFLVIKDNSYHYL